jgi:hypothetical protein
MAWSRSRAPRNTARATAFATALRSVTRGRQDFVHPAPRARLGLLNAKVKECFERSLQKYSPTRRIGPRRKCCSTPAVPPAQTIPIISVLNNERLLNAFRKHSGVPD